MKVTISIPVPSYLRKYLEVKFGEQYNAVQSDWFGLLVLNILSRKSDRDYMPVMGNAKDFFMITIGLSKSEKMGYIINRRKGRQLARALDNYFREELYSAAIINNRSFEIDYKTSIQNFMDQYGISEEDLPYETIRKDFNRRKRNITVKLDQVFK